MTDNDIGGRVRQAREQRGLTLADAAKRTRLPVNVVRAIERNDFDSLPAGMYRKAYLRTLAAEVGMDPRALSAEYDALHGPPAGPDAAAVVDTVPDKLVKELAPQRPTSLVTLAVVAIVAMAWSVLRPDAEPPASHTLRSGPETERLVRTSADTSDTTARDPDRATAITSPEQAFKVELSTTGWCWIAASSDGDRVVYGLVEPGQRVVLEGQHRISLRLGDAGAVRLSINDGPLRAAGADGEVVELDFTPGSVRGTDEGDEETASPVGQTG